MVYNTLKCPNIFLPRVRVFRGVSFYFKYSCDNCHRKHILQLEALHGEEKEQWPKGFGEQEKETD